MADRGPLAVDDPARTGPLLRSATLPPALDELASLVFPTSEVERSVAASFLRSRRLVPQVDATDALLWWVVSQMTAVGVTVRLLPELWPSVTQSVRSRSETAYRARAARVFGLPLLTHSTRFPPWWRRGLTRDVRVALRAMSAAGPLWIDDLLDVAAQARSSGRADRPDHDRMVAALVAAGARRVPGDGRWACDADPDERDRALIAAARTTGRSRHTVSDLQVILASVGADVRDGYAAIRRSPVVLRTGRNRYAVLGVD